MDIPDKLKCSLCTKLLNTPVRVQCCGVCYCDECIRYSILESEDPSLRLKCPNCLKDLFPDNLHADLSIRLELDAFIRAYRDSLKPAVVHPQQQSTSNSPSLIPSSKLSATVQQQRVKPKAFRVINPLAGTEVRKQTNAASRNAIPTYSSQSDNRNEVTKKKMYERMLYC